MKFAFKEKVNKRVGTNKEATSKADFTRFLESGMTATADGLGVIGAELRPSGKVDLVHCLCINLNEYGPDPSVFLDALDCEWFAYSTWNDGNPLVDKLLRHRFTVLMPLRHPVNSHEYQGIVAWVERQWGIVGARKNPGPIAKSVRDPGHLYFTPRAKNPESSREPWFYSYQAKRLDPFKLPGVGDCRRLVANLSDHVPRAEFLEQQRKRVADAGLTASQRAYIDDQLREFTLPPDRTEALNAIETFSLKFGGYMAQYPQAIDRATVVGIIAERAAAQGIDRADVSDFADNALEYGMGTPLRIPTLERPKLQLVGESAVNTVGKRFPGCPCEEHEIPSLYTLDAGGVWHCPPQKEGTTVEPQITNVCHRPLLLARRYTDEDEQEFVKLAWKRHGKWRSRIMPRSRILSGTDLIRAVGDYGAPVDQLNGKAVVAYLRHYERQNERHYEGARIVTQMGWHDGEFLVGDMRVDADGVHAQDDRKLIFDAAKTDASVVGQLGARGTFGAWKDLMRDLDQYPVIVAGLLTSACAPLIEATRTDSFIVDQSDPTSGGKSVAQGIAASLWGLPTKKGGIIIAWDSTPVHIGRCAGAFRHLPLFIDDTKHRRGQSEFLSQQVYRLTSKDRGRGTITGAQRTASFHTVVLTNGESSLASQVTDDGARARIVSVTGMPFKGKTTATYYIAERYRTAIADNYGHLGPMIAQRIAQRRPEHWRDLCDQVVQHYVNIGAANAKVLRKARAFANMHIALELINDICGFDWPYSILEDLWRAQSDDDTQRHKHEVALDELREVIASNHGKFWAPGKTVEPTGGWWGRIEAPMGTTPPNPNKHYVAIFPRRVLRELAEWWENNFWQYWGEMGVCGTTTEVIKVNGKSARLRRFGYEDIFPFQGQAGFDLDEDDESPV